VYRGHRVAVVVPAHNEARLVARTLGSVPELADLLVAVDDASEDATACEIARAANADDRIAPIYHDVNCGVGAAIVSGYRVALARGAEVVAVMDGDGQMDPRDLPALLDPLCDGTADLAKGNRFERLRPRGRMPRVRIVGNLILSAATSAGSGVGWPVDSQCGYTALSAEAIARLPLDRLYPRYGFPNDLLLRALECGLRVASVPVRSRYGEEISGIRPHVAIPRIAALLAAGAGRRIASVAARAPRTAPLRADERP
jgi:glycosyltransferase involved in cell wall biosynthesis